MGLDNPAGNTLRMLSILAGMMMSAAAVTALDVSLSSKGVSTKRRFVRWGICVAVAPVAYALVPWDEISRAFPLISILAFFTVLYPLVPARAPQIWSRFQPELVMGCVFSTVMLAKIALNVHLYHYGFYLAAPALVLVIALMATGVPTMLGRLSPGAGLLFRDVATVTIIAGVAAHLVSANQIYRAKILPIGEGSDRFLAFDEERGWQGPLTVRALDRIRDLTKRGNTIAVLPEGAMLNFLTRHSNSVPYVILMPPELSAFGERRILSAFEASPPDFIVLAHKDADEYGLLPFGVDSRYGLAIMTWIRAHYRRLEVIGRDPLTREGAGFEILEHWPVS
jgi:hypothetical protein